MKRILSIVLCLVLMLGMVTFAQAEQKFTPGTYTGEGFGKNGRIVVEATFSEDEITEINIVSHEETPGICEVALEQLPPAVLESQSSTAKAPASIAISACPHCRNRRALCPFAEKLAHGGAKTAFRRALSRTIAGKNEHE